jgi:hypothetical protein
MAEKHLLVLLTKVREQSRFSQLTGAFDIFYNDERFRNALERMDLKPLTKMNSLVDH